MAIFSTRQARQLFVVKDVIANAYDPLTPAGPAVVGDAFIGTLPDEHTGDPKAIYVQYFGVDGIVRSDLINLDSIMWYKGTPASEMARPLEVYEVNFDTTTFPVIIPGQDYMITITLFGHGTPGIESQLIKFGAVRALPADTPATLLSRLADSLNRSFKRERVPQLSFAEVGGALIISEIEQPWVRGKLESKPVFANIRCNFIEDVTAGVEAPWGIVTTPAPVGFIGNGKKIADIEHFYMGERADIYRQKGFPYNIETTYLIDPTLEYDVIDIHYAYQGNCEDIQKSEKTITLVMDVPSGVTANVVSALGTASSGFFNFTKI